MDHDRAPAGALRLHQYQALLEVSESITRHGETKAFEETKPRGVSR